MSAATDWFVAARHGLFVHWGLYSLLGDGEWVRKREALSRVTDSIHLNPVRAKVIVPEQVVAYRGSTLAALAADEKWWAREGLRGLGWTMVCSAAANPRGISSHAL